MVKGINPIKVHTRGRFSSSEALNDCEEGCGNLASPNMAKNRLEKYLPENT